MSSILPQEFRRFYFSRSVLIHCWLRHFSFNKMQLIRFIVRNRSFRECIDNSFLLINYHKKLKFGNRGKRRGSSIQTWNWYRYNFSQIDLDRKAMSLKLHRATPTRLTLIDAVDIILTIRCCRCGHWFCRCRCGHCFCRCRCRCRCGRSCCHCYRN